LTVVPVGTVTGILVAEPALVIVTTPLVSLAV
jgi:hypothetical protein